MNNSYIEKDVFNTLNNVNLKEYTKKKMNLSYLPWAFAWAEVKKRFPDANYTIYENDQGWNYFTDGRTCWTKVGVTIEGLEHIEELPVMDYRNKSVSLEKITSMDVNTSIQRGLTKAIARHGLGLYIFAGEDLPEAPGDADADAPNNPTPAPQGTPAPSDSSKESTTPKAESNPAPQKLPTPPAPVKENIPAPPPSAKVEAPKTTVKQAKKWTTVKSF